ncbi:MAG: 30S ribosome-binding factor RbfA [Calditrichaeota bacterium]|nr:30S ribosome-binding factor RbfA [Candidatus Cloacimonadota bacterium]MCA9785470.1 30S ribosome-binding factor RbfA [Candidatus Cloacimonadota bacterium]MCB1046159.1 30S ribosome-binding factor RbfA [Calditrichota bacterium]MCB9473043.1 30S ribosome-binding factor RbfA [Candidatus Delongbacteria bacterium]
MASDKRVARVAEQIRKEIGQMLARGVISGLGFVTLVEVRLSRDLGLARLFVSIQGTPAERRKSMSRLVAGSKELRHLLAGRLLIRAVPELRIELDESLDRVESVTHLLAQLEQERQELEGDSPSEPVADPDGEPRED